MHKAARIPRWCSKFGVPWRLMSTTRRPTVAAVAPADSPALKFLPHDKAEFIVADSLAAMQAHPSLSSAEALLWIPPGPPALLKELWHGGHLPNCRWVHGFYAGVDVIGDFAQELAHSDVPLTNGRGAFSLSLAEYAMTAALHFVKQVPRCMDNRRSKVWDKFVMAELRGRTLGLVGYGDIAQATAKLAKAFGMRVIALRRNASKPDETGLADLVLGPYRWVPQQSDHSRHLPTAHPLPTLPTPDQSDQLVSHRLSPAMRAVVRSSLRTSRLSSARATWSCAYCQARRRRAISSQRPNSAR